MPSLRIVVQARISSARLPAKALLPIGGVAGAALCVLRAGNRGGDIVLATSLHSDDDVLAEALNSYGITVFRGPLDNVLDRFVCATDDLSDDDIVVRLTADNVFPDGDFVDALVQQFMSKDVDYLGTNSPFDGLPYGLSAEVFSVQMLRKAALHASTDLEREHVTTWIRRNGICAETDASKFGLDRRYDHLRSTVDTLSDYVRIAKLFDALKEDPVKVSWRQLTDLLAASADAPVFRVPYRAEADGRASSILSLGTVQLGMPYGRANVQGQPSLADARNIIRIAIDHGITEIDTARAYGVSEQRIGMALRPDLQGRVRVITKLDPLSFLSADTSQIDVKRAVDASVFQSCRELGASRLDVLLLHRWAHREEYCGAIWERLLALRSDGVILKLGASVSSPDEAIEALKDEDVKHIQLPCNILDWRWEHPDFLAAIKNRPDIAVHVRSVFLQGILLGPAEIWPKNLVDISTYVHQLDQLVSDLGRESRADLCLAYLAGTDWVTSILVGVETESQLMQNLSLAKNLALTTAERIHVRNTFEDVPVNLLNPATWGVE